MIPLKDYNPSQRFPLVTVLLITLNAVVFVEDRLSGRYHQVAVETARGVLRVPEFIGGISAHYSLVPHSLVTAPSLVWPTLFISMFLHANWLHIGSNMLFLWVFGDNVEDTLGRLRFLLFYMSCGVAAAMTQVISSPLSTTPMVGASGAVAGVMGAYLLLFPRAVIRTLVPIFIFFTFLDLPAFVLIGYWALLQFINAAWLGGGGLLKGGGVAYFAHIGGFLAGMLFISTFHVTPPRRRYR